MKTKLAHIKTWLKVTYGAVVETKFFRGKSEQVRPHVAYEKADILELVGELQKQVSVQHCPGRGEKERRQQAVSALAVRFNLGTKSGSP